MGVSRLSHGHLIDVAKVDNHSGCVSEADGRHLMALVEHDRNGPPIATRLQRPQRRVVNDVMGEELEAHDKSPLLAHH